MEIFKQKLKILLIDQFQIKVWYLNIRPSITLSYTNTYMLY